MNFTCILFLGLTLFVFVTQAYIVSDGIGYGAVGALGYNGLYGTAYKTGYGAVCGTSCGSGYGTNCGTSCGNGYGNGCGVGCEAGYGCRSACAPACGSAAVCDTCQCMKTVIRPNVVERIPYSCSRRVQSSACRSSSGLYSGGVYGNTAVGSVGGTCSGYLNSGYLY